MSAPSSPLAGPVTTILCDADGTLFPSEEPAFRASATVTQQLAQRFGLTGDLTPEALRRASTGRNFRDSTVARLEAGGIRIEPAELEEWVRREKQVVTALLAEELVAQPEVLRAVKGWAGRYRLAVVTSSAMSRLAASLTATGLDEFFAPERRFSAEDSLPAPAGKPDPAIYRHALDRLACPPAEAVAIEDSANGVRAAVGAGLATVGLVQFAPEPERAALRDELRRAGAARVAATWAELEGWF